MPPISSRPVSASDALATRPIPHGDDEHLPVIGLGTWQTFDVGDAPGERALLPVAPQARSRCAAR